MEESRHRASPGAGAILFRERGYWPLLLMSTRDFQPKVRQKKKRKKKEKQQQPGNRSTQEKIPSFAARRKQE